MMPSHQALGQSSTGDNSLQAVLPVELRQPLQPEQQQPHNAPMQQHMAQTGANKDSEQHQAPPNQPQVEGATAEPTSHSRDKETQATVSSQDAMVQTDTPTQS